VIPSASGIKNTLNQDNWVRKPGGDERREFGRRDHLAGHPVDRGGNCLHFQHIAHGGACGKTPVVSHTRWPRSEPAETELRVTDTDVIIVGAAPTGLTLASELCLAGVRPLVLERLPRIREIRKAGGLSGQILELLRYRGLLERFEAASGHPRPTPRFPFGGMHIDFTVLADSPMQAVRLPQPALEHLLEDIAGERGAEIRRGHDVVGLHQSTHPDDATVTVDVRCPDGPYRVSARYLVGCDGVQSRVRALAGIAFPGIAYPEVNRLGHFTMPDSMTLRDDGDYDVPGFGRLRAGFTRTERGEFAIASYTPKDLGLYTSEEDDGNYDDDTPMTATEFQDSVRRVIGANIPLGEPTRLSRFTFHARQVERYRDGRVLLAGDTAHQFPAPGVGINAGMMDAVNLGWKLGADIVGWAPPGLLDTYSEERHVAAARTLLHTQAQMALRRGHDPAAEALRELLGELLVDEQPVHRIGALMAGADIRYRVPGPDHHALAGTFAPNLTLRADHGTTSMAALMHTARPVLLDLNDRADLREAARTWRHRVDIHSARTDQPPADALVIRPDAHVAWAASIGEPAETAVPALREALSSWFGAPLRASVDQR
jgi:2-polyprenyl-6-methoxyphenol hydroxylase-like FAD-dependent oxidoreductase